MTFFYNFTISGSVENKLGLLTGHNHSGCCHNLYTCITEVPNKKYGFKRKTVSSYVHLPYIATT